MNIKKLILLSTIGLIFVTPTFSANCNIKPTEEKKLLSMSYVDFDQTEQGWRKYANSGCFHAMGVLIDNYLVMHESSMIDWQIFGMTWHAGQMYAFNNEYGVARIRFQYSINPNESHDTHILWNDYVNATIAFLDNDMPKLKLHHDKIANGPSFNDKKLNLDIVDNLIKYFGRPYSVAYRSDN